MSLAAKDLSITRGYAAVLGHVSAALVPGQVTAICGPNGAGKSTLLLGLAGLLEPSAGQVTLSGAALAQMTPRDRARAIGYLPQHGEVAWDVSVESLVRLGRMPHGDRGNDAVESAVTALSLDDLRRRPVSQLSGGERARALLARVLAGEPQWILADEPLAALDLAHQLSLIEHFKTAAIEGQGVVLALHDLSLAMNHADRVLVLNNGALITDAPPEEALSSEVIAQVWGVETDWIGSEGSRALIVK